MDKSMQNALQNTRLLRAATSPPHVTLRHQYLARVEPFTEFVARLLDGQTFHHAFRVRDRRLPIGYKDRFLAEGLLTITSLEEAFERYWWASKDFAQNKKDLDKVCAFLKQAIKIERQGGADAVPLCLDSVRKVLAWGANGTGMSLYTANEKWARELGAQLLERVKVGRQEMTSADPRVDIFSADNGPRMNAGFTKYYSLACDNVVIYDGRVGAALGFLVRNFCIGRDLETVPPELQFPWGSQNQGAREANFALNRDPSRPPYVFPKLPGSGGANWAEANIAANWVLSSAISKSKAKWCQGSDGLRKVEAALFTIGYEMPSVASPFQRVKKLPRNASGRPSTNLTKVAYLLGEKPTSFRYSGTLEDGFRITFGSGASLHVSSRLLANLCNAFPNQIVSLGASRTNTPAGSIGHWLNRYSKDSGISLTSQHAARLVAVLKKEGIVDIVTRDDTRSRYRGRRPITVRFANTKRTRGFRNGASID